MWLSPLKKRRESKRCSITLGVDYTVETGPCRVRNFWGGERRGVFYYVTSAQQKYAIEHLVRNGLEYTLV